MSAAHGSPRTHHALRGSAAILLGAALLAASAGAQALSVTEVLDAGGDGQGQALSSPQDIALGPGGRLYVPSNATDVVFEVAPGGVITTILDAGGDGVHGCDVPLGVAVDLSGNVYVACEGSDNVFRIAPDRSVTRVLDASGDGLGNTLDAPDDVAVDAAGNLYVAGFVSDNVFKVTPGGVVTEIMDNTGDGSHRLENPNSLAVDGSGNLFISGFLSHNVLKITPAGVKSEVIGDVWLFRPRNLAVGPSGNVYVIHDSGSIYKVTPSGAITGTGQVLLQGEEDLAVDAAENLYVAAAGSNMLARISPSGKVVILVDFLGDGAGNTLSGSDGVAVDASGRVWVSGRASNNVFEVEPIWSNLGGETLGAFGRPALDVFGSMQPLSNFGLDLTQVTPNALALAWVSVTSTPTPAFGGTLHAFPPLGEFLVAANASGRFPALINWPAGTPAGVDLYFQFLVQDGTVPGGITLSNAMTGTTP